MARPTKVGLDYFSLDVILDDNVELMEAECGLQGFAVLIKLWQKIYSEGYYIEWKEDNAMLFSRKINSELTLVNSVIISCLSRKIFSQDLYDKYKILTSKAIQKRYLTACKQSKRANVSFIKEYLLVNSELTQVISELTSINSEFSTQSKVKESKVKESKEKVNNADINSLSLSLSKDVEKLTNGKWYLAKDIERVNALIEMYSYEWTREAIIKVISKGKISVGYAEGILKNWQSEGKPEFKRGEEDGSNKQHIESEDRQGIGIEL